jgi:hypothetical protein
MQQSQKELIDNSGMPLSAVEFQEAADQVKAALSIKIFYIFKTCLSNQTGFSLRQFLLLRRTNHNITRKCKVLL